jgi:hypothetical protein
MAVMMILDWQGVTTDDYDRVNEIIGISSDADAPPGLISHVAAVSDEGELLIADLWESEEALGTFVESKLGPALKQAGLPESEPRVMPVHNRLRGGAPEGNVLILLEIEDTPTESYDAMTSQLAEHAGDGSAHPAHTHAVATDGSTLVVLDEWASADAFGTFMQERIMPLAEQTPMGRVNQRALRVHNRIRGRAHAGA